MMFNLRSTKARTAKAGRILRGLGLALACALMLTSPAMADTEAKKTRIGVMLFDGVLTSDVTAPLEVFGSAIANETLDTLEVVTIGTTAGTITTHEGLTLVADYSVADAPELDVLLVGSAYDMDPVLDDTAFMDFIRERGEVADWLASNCSGAYVLAAAGFLNGVRATTYPGGEIWLKLNHPRVRIDMNETVVVDKNVITSNGSMVSYAAAFELLRQIGGDKVADEVSENLYYARLAKSFGS